MKVVELTQTKFTPFQDGILINSWWYWFKHRHPEISIWQVKGLEVRAHGLTFNSCNLFYTNLQSLYSQHNYSSNHIWNSHEIGIQVGRQFRARVLVKKGANAIYSIIPKFHE